jgi:predicted nucleic acid-binding protein
VIHPGWGPFLFDTSAESWFARVREPVAINWWREYLKRNPVHISSITIFERMRGYAMLWHRADHERRAMVESARVAYLAAGRKVWPVDAAVSTVAGEIAALIPEPPTPPKRSHRASESRAERLARWRFDGIIAATALVTGMTLLHNNAADFEVIRSGIETNPERFPQLGPLNLIRCGRLASNFENVSRPFW